MIRGTDPGVQERLAQQSGELVGTERERSQELLRALAAVDLAYEEHFEELGISDARVRLLTLLYSLVNEGLEPSQIAVRLGMSRAAVTSLVNGHEKAGLVWRRPSKGALRGFKVDITEKGMDLMEDFCVAHAPRMVAVANALTPKEHKQLLELLAKVEQALVRENEKKVEVAEE